MNLVTNNQNTNTLKMTSLQIAEMLDKRHDTVRTSIERLMNRGVIAVTSLTEASFQDTLGRTQTTNVYEFEGEAGKRDSIIAIAQLSPQHTAILVDRWIELEKQVATLVPAAPALPTTFLEALKALVIVEEEKQVMQEQLIIAAPKVAYYEQVLDQKELYTISEVAKKNGITAQELNKLLFTVGVYDRRNPKNKTFKTAFIDKGYGKMITAKTGHTQAKLTIKGEVWVTTKAMQSETAKAIVAARQAKIPKKYKEEPKTSNQALDIIHHVNNLQIS